MDATSSEPLTKTLDESGIFAPVRKHFEALDAFLEAQVQEFAPAARESLRYTFAHRGKRLRPALVFFSGWKGEDAVEPDAVRAAATVELIHLATLVHDDILDDAALRHASPTLFAKYGAHTAGLLGDAIFAHALKLMSDCDEVELCRALAVATRKICTGEIWQTTERGNAALSLEDYFEIIQMKTGELFEVSALLGASLAGRGADAGAAFARFGRHLGRAYQIFDDIVDYLGTESAIGKTLGTDLSSGKFTLPEILFFRGLDAREREAFLAEAAAGTLALGDVSERMRAAGVFGESREYFLKETRLAADALAPYAGTPGTEHLLALADFVAAQVRKIS